MSEKEQDYIKIIAEKRRDIKKKLLFVKTHFGQPSKMDVASYLWVIFAGNIVYKSQDLVLLLEAHERDEGSGLKAPLYTLLRSILEDTMYMRYLLHDLDKSGLQKRFDALKYHESKIRNKLLNSLMDLESKGKFHFDIEDDRHVLSAKGMKGRVDKNQGDMDFLEDRYKSDVEFERICNNLDKVIEVCKAYDSAKGIEKTIKKEEAKSLEWVYNYLYRFKSMYSHQSLTSQEDVLGHVWGSRTLNSNIEIESLMAAILESVQESGDLVLGSIKLNSKRH